MQVQEPPGTSKPKWLRKLERESWQAELIISGLAIIGSLQLPGLLDAAERYTLLNYDRDTLFICYIVFIYWKIFVNGVIILFLFHFVVRALWIGLVGLNSVFPGGFSPNQRYSQHFQDNLRAEYGDIDGFITRLDRLGSGVFGVGFGIFGIFFNLGLIGVLVIVFHGWLVGRGVAPGRIMIGLLCFLIPLITVSFISMMLHTKRFRDGRIARRFLWPVTKTISSISYPLGGRYIVTANNLITSYYIDRKGLPIYFVVGMAILIFFGMATAIRDPNIVFFIDKVYHRMAEDSTRLVDHYPTGEEFEGIYYRPLIEVGGPPGGEGLSVWVPLPERETIIMLADCSQPEVSATTDRGEARQLRRLRVVACAREYLYVALNGAALTEFDVKRQDVVNEAGEQFGVRINLPRVDLRDGENMLEVTTSYPHQDTGAPRRSFTPFYHRPRELLKDANR